MVEIFKNFIIAVVMFVAAGIAMFFAFLIGALIVEYLHRVYLWFINRKHL